MSIFIQRDGRITSAATEAPEQVKLAHNGGLPTGNYPESAKVEYIRADLSAASEAAARREGWNAAIEAAAAWIETVPDVLPNRQEIAAAILAMKETDQ